MTSLVKGQSAYLYNTVPLQKEEFEIFYQVNIHGPGDRGADGMVLWLTEKPVDTVGPFLAGPNKWKGMALLLDTFDNDAQGDNPKISLLSNDGQKLVNADGDGKELEVGSCLYGLRNTAEELTIRLKYHFGTVSVSVGAKETALDQYHPCIENVYVVDVPASGYHLSVTAKTGGLVDNQDVVSIVAFGGEMNHEEEEKHLEENHADELNHHLSEEEKAQAAERRKKREKVLEDDDDEETKGLPEHHTRPPLAFHFGTIFKDLKDIHKKEHPDNEAFATDLRLPEIQNLTSDDERFPYILDSMFVIEEHTDLMIKAFESILTLIDNERYQVQQNHHQFAEAFKALYEQVATKKDVEEALQVLAGKKSLLKASRKIHKLVDTALDAVDGKDSPVGKLGEVGKQMAPVGRSLSDHQAKNRQALNRAQIELAALMKAARDGTKMTFLDWVMIAELVVFLIFVLFKAFRKKQKTSIL